MEAETSPRPLAPKVITAGSLQADLANAVAEYQTLAGQVADLQSQLTALSQARLVAAGKVEAYQALLDSLGG